MSIAIIFFLGFIAAVAIGQKLKINCGIVAIAIGFVLTWLLGGEQNNTPAAFIKAFPVTLFWNYTIPVIFYAFASANGTMQLLGRKIAYKFRNARWALPFAVAIVAAVVAAAGAGTMNTAIVGPLAWGMSIAAGVSPMVVPFALWSGSFMGSFLPWTSNGSLHVGMYGQYLEGVDPLGMCMRLSLYNAAMGIVVLLAVYLLNRAWKLSDSGAEDFLHEPEQFSSGQKNTLIVIFGCIALLLVPSVINQFAPNGVCAWMSKNLSMPVTATAGISLVAVLGGNDLKKVFSRDVNWNMIFMISGMGMYCTLANSLGVVEILGEAMQSLPSFLIAPSFALLGSALSFVTSAATVQPLMMSMIPALAPAAGLSYGALVVPLMLGSGCTSMSPISTGGALCLIGCPNETAPKVFNRLLVTAIAAMIVVALVCMTPVISIGA
ncbi:MAG: SLC13 family permease [Eubacteriales bacterium]|nr:SLC13 family permease [Eubacteriales bacterium]